MNTFTSGQNVKNMVKYKYVAMVLATASSFTKIYIYRRAVS
jgi:hypothetical protein